VRTAVNLTTSLPEPGSELRSTCRLRADLRLRWWHEIGLVALFYFGYDAVRGLRHGSLATADHNGWIVLHAERALDLAPEHLLNQALWRLPVLAVLAAYFYAILHFIVTPGVLIWLYRRRPEQYGQARTVLAAATTMALIGFWAFPTTPPRLLPGASIHDTLASVHQWGWWAGQTSAPRGLGGLANDFAAMPSLHEAWALWAGWFVAHYARSRRVRILGVAYPVLTAVVVIATGNHYLLDVIAGAALTLLASRFIIATGWYRRDLYQIDGGFGTLGLNEALALMKRTTDHRSGFTNQTHLRRRFRAPHQFQRQHSRPTDCGSAPTDELELRSSQERSPDGPALHVHHAYANQVAAAHGVLASRSWTQRGQRWSWHSSRLRTRSAGSREGCW
jgi:hypothetical protein